MCSAGILHRCYIFPTFNNVQNAPKEKETVATQVAASAEVSVLEKNLRHSTSEFQYKRMKMKNKHVPGQLRLGDEAYLKSLISSLHKSWREKRPSKNNPQSTRDNFIKKPVFETVNDTLPFEGADVQSCRVPKRNFNYDESPLFQRVADLINIRT